MTSQPRDKTRDSTKHDTAKFGIDLYCTHGPKTNLKTRACPGLHLQLLARNPFFLRDRPEHPPPPPLIK